MSRQSYQITPEIHQLNNCVYVVKVNGDDFCCADTRDLAYLIRDKLAVTLLDELKSEPKYQDGWTKIVLETDENNVTIISTIALGRLYDGPKQPVYTLNVSIVFYGMVRLPPANDQPQYATISHIPVDPPKTVTIEIQPQPQVGILSTSPLPPPLPPLAPPPPLPRRPMMRRKRHAPSSNMDHIIDELKLNLRRLQVDTQN